MHLAKRFWVLVDEATNAARLSAAEILGDDASGGVDDWILWAGVFCRWAIVEGEEFGFSVWMMEFSTFEETRSARVAWLWARPENAVFFFDSFPGHSTVVDLSSLGGYGEFVENFLGIVVGELFLGTESVC